MALYTLEKSSNTKKKYMITIISKKTNRQRTKHFGANGMSDFTIHKDQARKQRYINRHKSNEDWTDAETSSFYSRWVLWNLPSLKNSWNDTKAKLKSMSYIK